MGLTHFPKALEASNAVAVSKIDHNLFTTKRTERLPIIQWKLVRRFKVVSLFEHKLV